MLLAVEEMEALPELRPELIWFAMLVPAERKLVMEDVKAVTTAVAIALAVAAMDALPPLKPELMPFAMLVPADLMPETEEVKALTT